MATKPSAHHENAAGHRRERREHNKEAYHEEGDDRRQAGPDPDLAHCLRTRSGRLQQIAVEDNGELRYEYSRK